MFFAVLLDNNAILYKVQDIIKKDSWIVNESESDVSQELSEEITINRRYLLRILAATAGGVILANIPDKWDKPSLEVGVLPAHAQTSPIPTPVNVPTPVNGCSTTAGTLNVVMTWDTDANLELHIFEACSGIDVAPVGFGGPQGATIQHLGDAQGGAGSSETIRQINSGVIGEGTYGIHPGHISGTLPTTATITITTDIGDTIIPVTFTSSGYLFGLADVTFPGGEVTSSSQIAISEDHH